MLGSLISFGLESEPRNAARACSLLRLRAAGSVADFARPELLTLSRRLHRYMISRRDDISTPTDASRQREI